MIEIVCIMGFEQLGTTADQHYSISIDIIHVCGLTYSMSSMLYFNRDIYMSIDIHALMYLIQHAVKNS